MCAISHNATTVAPHSHFLVVSSVLMCVGASDVNFCGVYSEAERNRRQEFEAARRIQRWVRGFLVRQHFKLLHSQAVVIQKQWRGCLGRKRYLLVLKVVCFIFMLFHYHHPIAINTKIDVMIEHNDYPPGS